MSWIAEDVPWYLVQPDLRRPSMTDEDVAMSAPRRLGEFATRGEAQAAVADDLEVSSHFNFIVRGGEREKYVLAAEAILAGVDGVQIHGRYYRVREV